VDLSIFDARRSVTTSANPTPLALPPVSSVRSRKTTRTTSGPPLYKISGKVGRVAQKPLPRGGLPNSLVESIPDPLGAWTKSRDLPPLARKSFRERWKEGI
jgi:hypothetical protein